MSAAGLLFGIGFGFVLGWSRLTDYDVIRDMVLLQKFDVFLRWEQRSRRRQWRRGCCARAARGRSSVTFRSRGRLPDRRASMFLGAAIFGAGWALSGTCPGPAAAQLGRGQLAALFTLAGIFAGVALFGYLKRRREAAAAPPSEGERSAAAPGL